MASLEFCRVTIFLEFGKPIRNMKISSIHKRKEYYEFKNYTQIIYS